MAARWDASDDAKLALLFRETKLDPSKTDKKTISAALAKHWPGRGFKYESFAATYKRKCNKWVLEQTLQGKCGGAKRKCLMSLLQDCGHF